MEDCDSSECVSVCLNGSSSGDSIPSSNCSDCSSSSYDDVFDELFACPLPSPQGVDDYLSCDHNHNHHHVYPRVDDLDLSSLFTDNDIAHFVMESLL